MPFQAKCSLEQDTRLAFLSLSDVTVYLARRRCAFQCDELTNLILLLSAFSSVLVWLRWNSLAMETEDLHPRQPPEIQSPELVLWGCVESEHVKCGA